MSFSGEYFRSHPVKPSRSLVGQVVDQLDLEHIIRQHKGGGTTSFHTRMRIKVLFYAYLSNIYSCRRSSVPYRRTPTSCGFPATVHLIIGRSIISRESVSRDRYKSYLQVLFGCCMIWNMLA